MADLEPMVGRYVRLDLGGRSLRIYFEEAGTGIALPAGSRIRCGEAGWTQA